MMVRDERTSHADSGFVMFMFMFITAVLLTSVAFAVDMGRAYDEQRKIQIIADAAALRRELPAQWRATLDACESASPPGAEQCAAADNAYLHRHVWRAPFDPRIAAYRAAMPSNAGKAVYNGMWGPVEFRATGTLRDYDGEPLLARLNGRRILFVAGEHDEARPRTVAAFARRVPNARYRTIPGAAHAILGDAPGAYLPLISAWCRSNDSG